MKKIIHSFAFAACLLTFPLQGKAQNDIFIDNGIPYVSQAPRDAAYGPDIVIDEYTTPLLMYPNPTTSQAKVLLGEPAENTVKVDIIDLNGRAYNQATYGPGTNTIDIDMSPLAAGLYTVRIMERGRPIQYVRAIKEQL